MVRSLLLTVGSAVFPALVGGTALCSQSSPELATTTGFSISRAAGTSLTPRSTVAISASGLVAINNQGDQTIAIVGADGSDRGAVQIRGSGGGMGDPHFGWAGDTLWATWGTQILLFDSVGKPGRSIDRLMTVQGPTPESRLRVSATNAANPLGLPRVVAVLPGGGLILEAMLPGLTAPERGSVPDLVVSDSGGFRSLMGWNNLSLSDCSYASLPIPFCRQLLPQWSVGGDPQLVSVRVDSSTTKPAFIVKKISLTGPSFERSYFYEPILATKAEMDSAIKVLQGRSLARALVDSALNSFRQKGPVAWSPLLRILPGSDGSIWLELMQRGPGHRWMVLASNGEVRGTVSVSEATRIQAVSATLALALVSDGSSTTRLVQMRVGR